MPKKNDTLILVCSLVLTGGILCAGLWGVKSHFFYPSSLTQETTDLEKNQSISLETTTLTIGTLGDADYYTDLVTYLKKKLGQHISIKIDGGSNLSYQQAKDRLLKKQWDIVFSLSPMNSIVANQNGYTWLGRMFPQYPPYYQSALFVRSDSKIQSINDLTPSTVIAMGDFNSASSFYMPSYDLYGKTLKIDLGNRGQTIREKVRKGQVDVGAAAYGDIVTNDPAFRIIHISRNIPGSGVYLSPNLSVNDRDLLKKTLLEAPESIQEQANYGKGDSPDYKEFVKITQRVEEILGCRDFSQISISFYCDETTNSPEQTPTNEITVIGEVNGTTKINKDTVRLVVVTSEGKIYHVFLESKILEKTSGVGSIFGIQNKKIKLQGVEPLNSSDSIPKLTVRSPNQLKIL